MGWVKIKASRTHSDIFRIGGFKNQQAARLQSSQRLCYQITQVIKRNVFREMEPRYDTALMFRNGFKVPYGLAPDIGAYEWVGTNSLSNFRITSIVRTNDLWLIRGEGPSNQLGHILLSLDLSEWSDLGLVIPSPDSGRFTFSDPSTASRSVVFYRILSP